MYEQRTGGRFEVPYSPHHERLQEKAAGGKFSEQILTDFRLSWRFTGSERNQHVLFYLIGLQYFQAGELVQRAVEESFRNIPEAEWRKRARPPLQHQTLQEGHVEREGANEWNKFKKVASPNCIAETVRSMHDGSPHYEDMLLIFAHGMIQSDLRFVGKGRPQRSSDSRRFASFFREYVLIGEPPGSPTLYAMFDDMRRAVVLFPPFPLSDLASLWQLRHSGEQFFPDNFIRNAIAAGTDQCCSYYEIPIASSDEALYLQTGRVGNY